jgi:hypothetical protein
MDEYLATKSLLLQCLKRDEIAFINYKLHRNVICCATINAPLGANTEASQLFAHMTRDQQAINQQDNTQLTQSAILPAIRIETPLLEHQPLLAILNHVDAYMLKVQLCQQQH